MSLMGQSDYMPNPVVLSSAPTAATLQAVTEAQKAARQVAAALNTAEGYAELKALWNKIDVNGDGIVDAEEWSGGVSANPHLMNKYFGDGDAGGQHTYVRKVRTEKAIRAAFAKLDSKGTGLSWEQFSSTASRAVKRETRKATNAAAMAANQAAMKFLEAEEMRRKEARESREQRPGYILRPDSVIASTRDLVSIVALMLLYFVLPFEIAFVDAPVIPEPSDPLFIFNRVIDVIFLLEMVLTFFVAIPKATIDVGDGSLTGQAQNEDLRSGNALSMAAQYNYRPSAIAWSYLTSWFIIDFVAMVPSGFDTYFAATGEVPQIFAESNSTSGALGMAGGGGGEGGEEAFLADSQAASAIRLFRIVRITRLVRILRLLRLLSAIKVLSNLSKQEDSFILRLRDYAMMATVEHTRKIRVIVLICGMLVVTHLLACFLGMSVVMADEKLHSWWGTHGYCFPGETYRLTPNEPMKTRCLDAWGQWYVCYHTALALCFTMSWSEFVGDGPGEPYWPPSAGTSSHHPVYMFQPHERVVFFLVSFTGALLGMYLAAVFVTMVAPPVPEVREDITRICKQYNMSVITHRLLQDYFKQLEELCHVVPKPDLFARMTPALGDKLILDIHGVWIQKLPFVKDLTNGRSLFNNGPARSDVSIEAFNGMLCKMALAMKPALYMTRERPRSGRMYVIIKGVVMNDVTMGGAMVANPLLRSGDSWGAMAVILSVSTAATTGLVRALTSLQVIYMDRPAMDRLLKENPEFHPQWLRLRVWALHRRLAIGIVRAAAKMRMLLELRRNQKSAEEEGHVEALMPPPPPSPPATAAAAGAEGVVVEGKVDVKAVENGHEGKLDLQDEALARTIAGRSPTPCTGGGATRAAGVMSKIPVVRPAPGTPGSLRAAASSKVAAARRMKAASKKRPSTEHGGGEREITQHF